MNVGKDLTVVYCVVIVIVITLTQLAYIIDTIKPTAPASLKM